jgi:hypothetical protein
MAVLAPRVVFAQCRPGGQPVAEDRPRLVERLVKRAGWKGDGGDLVHGWLD